MTDPHAVRSPATAPDLTVVEFLRVRLDETEQRERAKRRNPEPLGRECPVCTLRVRSVWVVSNIVTLGPCDHIVTADDYLAWCGTESAADEAVLRDVAAKRRIIEHEDMYGENDWVLRFLAEVYDQHPDYNERWRP